MSIRSWLSETSPANGFWANASYLACVVAGTFVVLGSARAQQLVNDSVIQANFTGISQIGANVGTITQMVFGPDGGLYVSTFTNGVKRYDYSPTGGLTNPTTVWSRTAVAFRVARHDRKCNLHSVAGCPLI
jgi:hypothetical protein